MADSPRLLIAPFPGWETVRDRATGLQWAVRTLETGEEALRVLQDDPAVVAAVLPAELPDGTAGDLIRRAGEDTAARFVVVAPPDLRGPLLGAGAEEVFEPDAAPGRILDRLELIRVRRRIIDDLGLVVRSPAMVELFERALRIAPLKVNALITGESGTGKELLAQAIHRASDRRDAPFVPVNVGALPENLVESELFGHERGAFTSADSRRIGRFEMANHGTLFLDEIGEMPVAAQVNLLRVLEEERFLRVGGSEPIRVDVRVVAATNRELEEMVRAGRFRRDLFYRLKVVHLEIPPLRARRDEIPVLTRAFASAAAARHGILFPGFSRDGLEALRRYDWPGNVRELRNLVDGIVALRPEEPVRREDLPGYVLHGSGGERSLPALPTDHSVAEREFIIQSLLALRAEVAALRELILAGRGGAWPAPDRRAVYPVGPVRVEPEDPDLGGGLSLKDIERRTIERALRDSGGNRRQAAQALGMSERTLYRRIRDYGIAEFDGS